jgi:hypothetical protein
MAKEKGKYYIHSWKEIRFRNKKTRKVKLLNSKGQHEAMDVKWTKHKKKIQRVFVEK